MPYLPICPPVQIAPNKPGTKNNSSNKPASLGTQKFIYSSRIQNQSSYGKKMYYADLKIDAFGTLAGSGAPLKNTFG
jgi:hypothetical protein